MMVVMLFHPLGFAHRKPLAQQFGRLPNNSDGASLPTPTGKNLRRERQPFHVAGHGQRTDKRGSVASVLFPHTVLSYQNAAGGRYTPPRRGPAAAGAEIGRDRRGAPGERFAGSVAGGLERCGLRMRRVFVYLV